MQLNFKLARTRKRTFQQMNTHTHTHTYISKLCFQYFQTSSEHDYIWRGLLSRCSHVHPDMQAVLQEQRAGQRAFLRHRFLTGPSHPLLHCPCHPRCHLGPGLPPPPGYHLLPHKCCGGCSRHQSPSGRTEAGSPGPSRRWSASEFSGSQRCAQ